MSNTTTTKTSKKTTRRLVAGKTATASIAATPAPITDAQVAERAFYIYLNEGCPDGRHLDHWTQAVAELRG